MILDTSNYLSGKEEFRDVYGEMYMFLPAKVRLLNDLSTSSCIPPLIRLLTSLFTYCQNLRNRKDKKNKKKKHQNDEDTDSNEEIVNDNMEQAISKGEKPPDLRKLNMDELKDLCRKFGMSEETLVITKRWQLVKFIKANARDEHSDLFREKKLNQQELNKKFQEQVDAHFKDQCKWLRGECEFSSTPMLMLDSSVNQIGDFQPPDLSDIGADYGLDDLIMSSPEKKLQYEDLTLISLPGQREKIPSTQLTVLTVIFQMKNDKVDLASKTSRNNRPATQEYHNKIANNTITLTESMECA